MYDIQKVFHAAYKAYCGRFQPTGQQHKAACAIMACKSGELGYNVSICRDCGHTERHNNSCRNRNCPCCQALLKEVWIDSCRSEVVDAPYFHVVFTVPAQLRPLIYANQALLHGLLHTCAAKALLELAADKTFLGATPGIIQVLHTWGQELKFHPHVHCIISSGGLTKAKRFVRSSGGFFLPVRALGNLFRGKFLDQLSRLFCSGKLTLPGSCRELGEPGVWACFRDALYGKTWLPHMKETFHGSGNAIEYPGRYAHRVAISNARISRVDDDSVSFWAKDYKTDEQKVVSLSHVEFLRRFLIHVLPSGFQKIRYYGFLANRFKKAN